MMICPRCRDANEGSCRKRSTQIRVLLMRVGARAKQIRTVTTKAVVRPILLAKIVDAERLQS